MATTINANNTDGVVITPDTSGELELQANGVTKAKVTANGLQDANGNSLRGGMYRNLIINGDMRIDQRYAGASSGNISAGTTTYTLDRWSLFLGNTSAVATIQQDSSAPADFTNSLKISVTTADSSVDSEDRSRLNQRIEGYNFANLNYGSSNAKTLTLSFWVKSNITGTFSVVFYNGPNNRSFLKNYTINSANTWEKKTITITGDTTGTWLTTNGTGLNLSFNLMAGTNQQNTENIWQAVGGPYGTSSQANLFSSTSNTFYITGVQLEVGEGASDFEHLPYDVQLQRCMRYYQLIKGGVAIAQNTTNLLGNFALFLPMRTTPSIGKTSGNFQFGDMVSAGYTTSSSPARGGYTNDNLRVNYTLVGFAGLTAYRSYQPEPTVGNPALFTCDAEL